MPLVKSAYQKMILISQPKHILWILKRTVSMRQTFLYPNHMLKLMGKNIFTTLRSTIYFHICSTRGVVVASSIHSNNKLNETERVIFNICLVELASRLSSCVISIINECNLGENITVMRYMTIDNTIMTYLTWETVCNGVSTFRWPRCNDARKPVFGGCEEVKLKPVCLAKQTS